MGIHEVFERLNADTNKRLLKNAKESEDWRLAFDMVSPTNVDGIYLVSHLGKTNHYVPKENRFISNVWYNFATNFNYAITSNDTAIVRRDGENGLGEYNLLKKDGTFLLTEWVMQINIVNDENNPYKQYFGIRKIENGKITKYQIDSNGNIRD